MMIIADRRVFIWNTGWICNILILLRGVTCDNHVDNVNQMSSSSSSSSSSSLPSSSGSSSPSSPSLSPGSQYFAGVDASELPETMRQSKAAVTAADIDDWYWHRRWANRPRRPPPPPYDPYYSIHPGAAAAAAAAAAPSTGSSTDRSFYYPSRPNKPLRRTSMSMSAPITAPSSNSYTNADTDGLQSVFAKWNPKINLTWPPTMAFSSTNDYPDYTPSASYHHHHDDDYHHKQIQFIPIHMPCHHDHKKKEVSLVWPLIFLGLLFLPLLLGALLLPLAFLFITNIIQLLNLLQRTQGTGGGGATTQSGRRRRRRHLQHHPVIDEKIQLISNRLEDSLLKFLNLFADDTVTMRRKM